MLHRLASIHWRLLHSQHVAIALYKNIRIIMSYHRHNAIKPYVARNVPKLDMMRIAPFNANMPTCSVMPRLREQLIIWIRQRRCEFIPEMMCQSQRKSLK